MMAPVATFTDGSASKRRTRLASASRSSTPSESTCTMYLPWLLYRARLSALDLPWAASSHCMASSGWTAWQREKAANESSELALFTRNTLILSAG